ncbi:MAG TPA: cytochrome c [Hyphomicrobium sp.]|nr:cytochrome c [Hyphomicrobium sp.]
MMSAKIRIAAAFLAAAAWSWLPAQAEDLKAKGEALLTKNCVRCHAIGPTGESTHKQAPPFRQIVTRYPLDDLAEGLAEGLTTGHPDMPEFVFSPGDIDGILAYLQDLKDKTDGGAPGTAE